MSAPSPLSAFSRITLAAPTTRADVAVPNSVPVAAFLPLLLRQLDQNTDSTVPGHGGWWLCRADGRRIDLSRSMDANEVRDGDVLVLQPNRAVVEEPLFDDVVELVGRDAVGQRWSARDRRVACAVLGGLAALAALAALARMPKHGILIPAICIGVAAVLLLGGFALSRAAGDLPAGGFVAALAGPYAAVGAALSVSDSWDRNRLVLACGAVLVVAAILPALVGGYEAVAGAYAMLAIFGGLGCLLTIVGHTTTVRAASVVAPLAMAATTVLPPLPLRLARLPRPQLASTAQDLAEVTADVDQAVTAERVRNARLLLTGLSTGAFVAAGAGVLILVDSHNPWAQALAGVLVTLLLLRTRIYSARQPVLAAVVVAIVVLAGMALLFLTSDRLQALAVLAVVTGAVAVAALVSGATAGRWTASPRQRRMVDLFETLLLVAVAPLVLGVWNLYSTVFHLGS